MLTFAVGYSIRKAEPEVDNIDAILFLRRALVLEGQQMQLIGKGNNFCLIMGGGERLQARVVRARRRSATPAKSLEALEAFCKPARTPRSAGEPPHWVIC